ncbi:hypothetical protein [Streptomyces shaanxiensis]
MRIRTRGAVRDRLRGRGGRHGGGEVDPHAGFFDHVLAALASFGTGGEQK